MTWGNILPLVLFTAVLVAVLVFAVPRARRNRHKAWEEAGLLPEQIDPHRVPQSNQQDDRQRDPNKGDPADGGGRR